MTPDVPPQILVRLLLGGFLVLALPTAVCAQPECAPWGNLYGIRTEGHLMEFETKICVLDSNLNEIAATGHYRVEPKFRREGQRQITSSTLGGIRFHQTVEETGPGAASIELSITALTNAAVAGGSFSIALPASTTREGTIEILGGAGAIETIPVARLGNRGKSETFTARGVRFKSAKGELAIKIAQELKIIVRRDEKDGGRIKAYFLALPGSLNAGQQSTTVFELRAVEEIDRAVAAIRIDPRQPGRAFDGVGGNFRIQFPKQDPAIIEYNLANMRVAWARSCMWWQAWDPDEAANPLAVALEGRLEPKVLEQIRSDQNIARSGRPMIISTWDPPAWARLEGPRRPGTYGDPLNPAKSDRIAESIAGYLLFLKQQFGIEAALFSFNEPDIGINVLQTPEEHVNMIKILGRKFAAKGLATKLLLADTSNATKEALRLAQAAVNDFEARQYIAAVAFHTWGGCDTESLRGWAEVSRQLNVPLMATETGVDSEAHHNPDLFHELSYQLQQADLYVRLLAICQPLNLLEWQLTADYSVLNGGGVYGWSGELRPTMRFWTLKQIGETPRGSFAIPAVSSHRLVTAAAYADTLNGTYTVHLVNNGAARPAKVSGLPESVKELRVFVTDQNRGLAEQESIPVAAGEASFELPACSFTSVASRSATPQSPRASSRAAGTFPVSP